MDEDEQDITDMLIGCAVAKRFRQFVPDCTETSWFAVAIAAMEVIRVISKTEGDGLEALDEFFALEEAVAL